MVSVSLTGGPGQRSALTGQRSTRADSNWDLGWAGLGWAGPDTWHAVVLPRHGHGLIPGCVHSCGRVGVAHGGPRGLVHRPQTGP